jgi:hypothetical protein
MFIERMILALPIAMLVFALSYGGGPEKAPRARGEFAQPLDARALLKKLDTLDVRLQEAQASIDQAVVKLANVREDYDRDATRLRLDVLYRLESGLIADIERTRSELAQR